MLTKKRQSRCAYKHSTKIKFRRKTLNKLKTFIFYDEYLDALNTLSDEKAGRMIERICKFIYADEPLEQLVLRMKNGIPT